MLWVPTLRVLVLQVALRVLPAPVTADAAQPAIDTPPSLKVTVPVGFAPVTVTVKVTLVLNVDGFNELARVVVVGKDITDVTAAPASMMPAPHANVPVVEQSRTVPTGNARA